jgi:hypothetical protein
VTINGVGKTASQVSYTAGIESIGTALKPGAFLRNVKGKDIVDGQHVLEHDGNSYVSVDDQQFRIPTDIASAEVFVDQLVAKGMLRINAVVATLGEEDTKISERSLRRHVAQTTGLSPYFFHQIQRAQQAVQLLQQGMSLAQVAAETGYTDQAHMTKAVKQLIGRTPTQILAEQRKR